MPNPTIQPDQQSAPGVTLVALTKSDTTKFQPTRGLYVGGAGDVAVVDLSGNSVTLVGALAGSVLPVRVVQLLATGTSATSVVAIY